ncbi:hypothetical protein CB1_000932015 [Camelus ferus]|nr:hypothetical protein CB1_000932015 [Camelus ferus]
MKLEAVDRSNPSLVCVATIADIAEDRLLVHFDSWDDSHDYWCDVNSPYVQPVGWCRENGRTLVAPQGYPDPEKFSWTEYLEATQTYAVPARVFKMRLPHGFLPNMKLEVVDKRNPRLIRVATIVDVDDQRIKGPRGSDCPQERGGSSPGLLCEELSREPEGTPGMPTGAPALCGSPGFACWTWRTIFLVVVTLEVFLLLLSCSTFCHERCTSWRGADVQGEEPSAVVPPDSFAFCAEPMLRVLPGGTVRLSSLIFRCVPSRSGLSVTGVVFSKNCYLWILSSSGLHTERFSLASVVPEGTGRVHHVLCAALGSLTARPLLSEAPSPRLLLRVLSRHPLQGLLATCVTYRRTESPGRSVSSALPSVVHVHFDGWDHKYDYWTDADSPDIHPAGWCDVTGHPLEVPCRSHTAFRGRGRDAAIVYMCPPQGVTGGLTACLGAALEGGSARLGHFSCARYFCRHQRVAGIRAEDTAAARPSAAPTLSVKARRPRLPIRRFP